MRPSLGARRHAAKLRAARIESAIGIATVCGAAALALALPAYCLFAAWQDHGFGFALATALGVR